MAVALWLELLYRGDERDVKIWEGTLCAQAMVLFVTMEHPHTTCIWSDKGQSRPYRSLSQIENNDILAFDIFTITLYTGSVEPGELKEGPGAAEFDTASRISCSED